jgi:hypothetical protein
MDVTVGFVVPETVSPNENFTITFPGEPSVLQSSLNGLTANNYSNLSQTYQVQGGGAFVDGSIVNPGVAILNPGDIETAHTAEIIAPDKFKMLTPGPLAPGTLITPTVSVQVQAPESGSVTVNAFQRTISMRLNNVFNAATTCALPTTTLATVPVVN